MLKRVKALLRANKEAYRIPRRVQDLIPIKRIWEDGIFQVGPDLYSQTYRFEDVNYLSSSKSTQASLKERYMQLLNSLDPDAMTKNHHCQPSSAEGLPGGWRSYAGPRRRAG